MPSPYRIISASSGHLETYFIINAETKGDQENESIVFVIGLKINHALIQKVLSEGVKL